MGETTINSALCQDGPSLLRALDSGSKSGTLQKINHSSVDMESTSASVQHRSHKMWYGIAVVVVFLGLAGVCLWAYREPIPEKGTPSTLVSCILHGGKWSPSTPPFARSYCALKTSDGGKHCQTTAECQGICQPVYEPNSGGSYYYRTDYGQCSDGLPVSTAHYFEHKPFTDSEF